MSQRLGLVTIGQAPRDDIVPQMAAYLPPGVEIVQAGALDGLTRDQLALMAPGPGDYVLISRLADGQSVTVARRHVLPRLQAAVTGLQQAGCQVTAVLCTGTFPDLETTGLLIEPERLFHAACAGAVGHGRLGALIPLESQVQQAQARWAALGVDALVLAASPYGPVEAVVTAAHRLREAGAGLVAMDCFGFTEQMRRQVRQAAGCPVVLANSYLARVLAELLAGG